MTVSFGESDGKKKRLLNVAQKVLGDFHGALHEATAFGVVIHDAIVAEQFRVGGR